MLARVTVICGIIGFPLLLLSYSWIPFALTGREMGSWGYLIVIGEVGALFAGIVSVGLGIVVRRRTQSGTAEYRLASRGLVIGTLLLVFVVVPNILGALLFR